MARRRTRTRIGPGPVPSWMCTYADMMGLLLCFFVMLLSFSTLQEGRTKEALSSIKGALGVLEGMPVGANRIAAVEPPIPEVTTLTQADRRIGDIRARREETRRKIESFVNKLGLTDSIRIQMLEGGARLTLPCDGVFFATGSAELLPTGKQELKKIARIFEIQDTNIRIEGHTDDKPIRGGPFKDNWELSGERALNVLRYYIGEEGWRPESRFTFTGFGPSRPFDPALGNTTSEARARNRRVEVFIEASEDEPPPGITATGSVPSDDWATPLVQSATEIIVSATSGPPSP